MCLICISLDKKNIEPWEAIQNLKEISHSLDDNHIKEVESKIFDLLMPKESSLLSQWDKFCKKESISNKNC